MEKIGEDIFWVGVNDRETDLFESYWPLPKGVSYNSYLIQDRKNVLVDSVKAGYERQLFSEIEGRVPLQELDYLIVNHLEPDHSGALPTIMELAPELTVVGTEKCRDLLEGFYGISDRVRTVSDGETLELGDKTLQFVETPFVHWPETMVTYEASSQVLFSGDVFGGFGSLDGGIYDDQTDFSYYRDEILRYFSNIIGSFTGPVMAALGKVEDLSVDVVAPAHGPVWRSRPEKIMELYRRWAQMKGDPGVTLIYGSMYGNTASMMEVLARSIQNSGCDDLKVLDASRVHVSTLISEAWKRSGVVIGSPTYNSKIFPPVDQFLTLLEHKRLKNRIGGVFGSFGWAGGAAERIESVMDELSWDIAGPAVEFSGSPGQEDFEEGRKLGEKIGSKVQEFAED